MTTFTFQHHALKAHTITGQTWFESADIAAALGYAAKNSVTGIYANYKNEFAKDMSQVVESTTSGNYRKKTRVFSLRGVHLIAMFARTPVAEEFRKWVLDLIEREESKPRLPTVKRRGSYRNRKDNLPAGVYHNQSKYNPYRATAQNDGKFVHVGSYPTVDDAVQAIENYYRTGVVQRLRASKSIPQIAVEPLNDICANYQPEKIDFLNHLGTFLEAAQLLSCYKAGKDLAWELVAFTQEEASRQTVLS